MLDHLRKHTKLIIWLVVLTFAGFGGFTFGTSFRNDGRVAGEVFGKSVYSQEFNLFYRATQIFSGTPEPLTDPDLIRLKTWQNIILSKEADRLKIEVTDDEVRSEISRLLAEQNIINPDIGLYRRWVKATVNETPQDFEKQVREILRIQKLIKQASEHEVTEPTEMEIRAQFLRERNSLNIQMVRFDDLEEAQAFHEKVKDTPENWADETKDMQEQIRTTGLIALDAIINLWQVPEEDAFRIHKMDIGSISEPTPVGNRQAVIRVEDRTFADESRFEELKEKYREKIMNLALRSFLIDWGSEVQARAQLKDMLPRSTPRAPEPEAPAAPQETTETISETPAAEDA